MTKFDNFTSRACLVPLMDLDDFAPDLKDFAKDTVEKTGRLSNSLRAMAHADDLALQARLFLTAAGSGGSLGREFALLIRLAVSNINTCVYCSTHQIKQMVKMGLPSEKIKNIHDFMDHPAFNEEERAALAFAVALTRDASNIADDICARFVEVFNPRQRIEIALVATAMGVLNSFNDGLRIPIEDEALDVARDVAELFE